MAEHSEERNIRKSSDEEDIETERATLEVTMSIMAHKYYNCSDQIDRHNRIRSTGIPLKKVFKVNNWYTRPEHGLLAVLFVDAYHLYRKLKVEDWVAENPGQECAGDEREQLEADVSALYGNGPQPSNIKTQVSYLLRKYRKVIRPQYTRKKFVPRAIEAPTSEDSSNTAAINAIHNPINNPINNRKRKDANKAANEEFWRNHRPELHLILWPVTEIARLADHFLNKIYAVFGNQSILQLPQALSPTNDFVVYIGETMQVIYYICCIIFD